MDNDEEPSTSSRSRQSSESQEQAAAAVTLDSASESDKATGASSAGASEHKESTENLSTGAAAEGSRSGSSSTASTPTLSAKRTKIDIVLKPVGDAPILKQKRWAVDPDKEFGTIIQFIKNYLKLQSDNSLFVFVNQAFAPSPDQLIRNLYDCFGSDGKLILHYSKTVAWG